jgi:hypothetical protein
MATTSKTTLGDELRNLQSGVNANLHDATVIIGGVTYTGPQLSALIDTFLKAQADTVASKNSYHTTVINEKTSNLNARTFRAQVKGYVIGRYGKTNPILTTFGFVTTKSKKTTSAVKAVAVLKLKATRKARGTMSKKEKAKIKGSVDPSIAASLAGTAAAAAAPAGAGPAAVAPAMAPVAMEAPAVGVPGAGGHGAGPGEGHTP